MRKISDHCNLTESLLVKKMVEGVDEVEELKITSHLQECESCRKYAASLIDMRTAFTLDNTEKIKPRPETLDTLREKLLSPDRIDKRKVRSTAFTSKTHIYPAIAAGIIALMVIFSINSVRPVSEVASVDSTYQQIIYLTQPAIIDMNNFNQQAGGKSIREDSLLLNYINYKM